jgi:aspartate kinase
MSKTRLIVQKYGGATVADPQKIKQVAARLRELHNDGTKVVAVVSAMGKTTNQLIELANQVSSHPNRRELDMLLTTGERVAMALLSMALHDQGVPAISFTGSQAGIFTDESHVSAFITDVKAHRVTEALEQNKIVVLAGYQGVSPKTKEITTLGRGGTDTTAVAIAAHLNADRCEILKDVPAVFSADPNVVKDARPLRQLTYDQMLEMTFWGAKVLHYRSVELAKRKKVTLSIGSAHQKQSEGTLISDQTEKSMSVQNDFESSQILALNSFEKVLKLQIPAKSSGEGFATLQKFLQEKEIPAPQILSLKFAVGQLTAYLTGPDEIVAAIKEEIGRSSSAIQMDPQIYATIAATCTGVTSPQIIEKILAALKAANIEIFDVWMTAMSAIILISTTERKKALHQLHSLT